VGTFALLAPADRRRLRAFVVNRFRGDPTLFASGVEFLERRLARPCLGVVPYLEDLGLDEEDSVALQEQLAGPRPAWRDEGGATRRLRVAAIALPHVANATDLAALAAEPSVALAWLRDPGVLPEADLVVLPGSKQTLDDLAWLEQRGFGPALRAHVARGGLLVGVCGGLQMLGRVIADPHGMEGGGQRAGLGLLDLHTELGRDKTTVRASATLVDTHLFGQAVGPLALAGYEIHLGRSHNAPDTPALFRLRREGGVEDVADGACATSGRVLGTYLHGLFDADHFRHAALQAARAACALTPAVTLLPYTAQRAARFDRLAQHVREALAIDTLQGWLS
jgi:adenosylcobyric acid synthase